MPKYAHVIGDRVILYHVKQSLVADTIQKCTAFAIDAEGGLYRQMGEEIPPGVQAPRIIRALFVSGWMTATHPCDLGIIFLYYI